MEVDECWTYNGLLEKLATSQRSFLTTLKHLIWLYLKNNNILFNTPPNFFNIIHLSKNGVGYADLPLPFRRQYQEKASSNQDNAV